IPYESEVPRPFRFPSEPGAISRATRNESCSRASYFLGLCSQDSRHDLGHAIPVFGFGLQAALPCCRQCVVFRFAVVFRLAPFPCGPALMFEAIERGIERALLNFQAV